LTLVSFFSRRKKKTTDIHTPSTTHSKDEGSPAPAGVGCGCYTASPAAALACSNVASCRRRIAGASAFLRLLFCVVLTIAARFTDIPLLTI
jgi:hypothetical protein